MAEAVKETGNALFKLGQYGAAADRYTEALALTTAADKDLRVVLLSNRAFCQLKIENYGLALVRWKGAEPV